MKAHLALRYLRLTTLIISFLTGAIGVLGSSTASTTAAVGQGSHVTPAMEVLKYFDGRPAAALRLDAEDYGVILAHGDGPGQCDYLGARDIWVMEEGGTYYMHYDGAGVQGWLACLATSTNLVNWTKKGPALALGKSGEMDSASASYGVTYWDGATWHMFYLGTPNSSPAPDRVPWFPYTTMKAKAPSAAGPWTKQREVTPFSPKKGTYYSDTASPGHVLRNGNEYMMFFAASTDKPIKRTLSIARTKDLDGPWTIGPRSCHRKSRWKILHSTSSRPTRRGFFSQITSAFPPTMNWAWMLRIYRQSSAIRPVRERLNTLIPSGSIGPKI
jgi:hypothetical protein